MNMGLQYGLSGNPVMQLGNAAYMSLKGNRRFGDSAADIWESQPDLCRKIYHIHYLDFILIRIFPIFERKKSF